MALSQFNATFYFISPDELKIPDEYKMHLDKLGLKYFEHKEFADIVNEADIIYMTRVQKERFSDLIEYEKVKNTYILKAKMLANAKPNMKVLHPLPRVNEVDLDVDSHKSAYYFEQAQNGVYTRQAIISSILGIK